jgi:hypothetical protein
VADTLPVVEVEVDNRALPAAPAVQAAAAKVGRRQDLLQLLLEFMRLVVAVVRVEKIPQIMGAQMVVPES